MKFAKHILVVIALMATMAPCGHAHGHAAHDRDAGAAGKLMVLHVCSCHSCDAMPCSETREMPQETTAGTVSIASPDSATILFVLSETKPLLGAVSLSPSGGILASIQTVQLLI